MRDLTSSHQLAAIDHKDGPAMVIAGPGSGKTYVITRRFARLVDTHGIDPPDILTLTFTNAAAKEMRDRAYAFLGNKARGSTFGTFHSVFYSILKEHFRLSPENIIDSRQKYMIMCDIIRELKADTCDMASLADELLSGISRIKNGLNASFFSPVSGSDVTMDRIYEMYDRKLTAARLLDFDDMILKLKKLFLKYPEIQERYRKRYRYIQVDEFQDINPLQYEVLRMIGDDNIFVVGDDDQSIYGFRGATSGMMKEFLKDHTDCALYKLYTNHRCTGSIVRSSQNLISHNMDRFYKELAAFDDTGEEVEIRCFSGRKDEIKGIAEKMDMDRLDDYAILSRTNRIGSIMAAGLMDLGIRVKHKGRRNDIYHTSTGEDIIAYLKVACDMHSREDLLRIMNRPERYIDREAFAKEGAVLGDALMYYRGDRQRTASIAKWISDMKMISHMRPGTAVKYLIGVVGYKEIDKRWDPLAASCLMKSAERFLTIKEFLLYMENEEERMDRSGEKIDDETGVSIMSLHASKGLEFREVFIVDVNEGIIPGRRVMGDTDIEEERRLLYVGMTRACKKLHIYYIEEEHGKRLIPSVFISEIHPLSSKKV